MMFSSIVCGIDFSDNSRAALRSAGEIAGRFGAKLSVVAVNELILAQAAAAAYDVNYLQSATETALRTFIGETFTGKAPPIKVVVAIGAPADGILKVASDHHADLIVLGTHGLSGYKKIFFGSVAESVLRKTLIPVFVTTLPAPGRSEKSLTNGGLILAPVDFSDHSTDDVATAARLAQAISGSLLLLHVSPRAEGPALLHPFLEEQHRVLHAQAVTAMNKLTAAVGPSVPVETLVRPGHPAHEIISVASDRNAQVIVMGLGGGPGFSHRPGSIAYRVLSSGAGPVLALPRSTSQSSQSP